MSFPADAVEMDFNFEWQLSASFMYEKMITCNPCLGIDTTALTTV